MSPTRGWWNMTCWNGLSLDQQNRLIEVGNLPIGYVPEGDCDNPAQVEITTMWDVSPGPRFYCIECAIEYTELCRRIVARQQEGRKS